MPRLVVIIFHQGPGLRTKFTGTERALHSAEGALWVYLSSRA